MRASRLARISALLSTTLVGCGELEMGDRGQLAAGAALDAITHGEDADGDAGVVAVGDFCSGTLLSSRVVLTAAHCVVGGATPPVGFGPRPDEMVQVPVLASVLDPAFAGAPPTHDLAVLILAEPAPEDARPWPILETPMGADAVGRALRIVGYGAASADDEGPRARREGATRLDALDAESFSFDAQPSQTCHGDSGGPAFWTEAGVELLVGVTSSGDAACNLGAHDSRVDVAAAAFIAPLLQATADQSRGPGERCWFDAACAGGSCEPSLDEPALSVCAEPCGPADACADGLVCVETPGGARRCLPESHTAGTLGTGCTHAFECASNLCLGDPTEMRCSAWCVPDVAPCDQGLSCVEVGEDGRHACMATGATAWAAQGAAGCHAGGARSPLSWGALLVGVLVALARMRARRPVRNAAPRPSRDPMPQDAAPSPPGPEDIESFIRDGYLRIDGAFPRALADEARARLEQDLGCDPADPRTWTRPVVRLGVYSQPPFVAAANTPVLHAAFDALVGAGRWVPCGSMGTFPVRFPNAAEPDDTGWHIDASFGTDDPDFMSWRVNVRSRGRALLMLFLFSDVGDDDAPTRLRVGSHRDIARRLAPAGEAGLSLRELVADGIPATAARPEALATGPAGTVYLCHPFVVHAGQAHRGARPRFLAQPPLLWRDEAAERGAERTPVGEAIRLAIASG